MTKRKNNVVSSMALLCFMLLVLLCSACATLPFKYQQLPPIADPHAYLQSVLQHADAPDHFAATARIKFQTPQGKLTARGAVFARIPSSFRVELYGFLNQLSLLFTTDGKTISFYYPSTNSFYSGTASDKNLVLLLGDDISPAAVTDLLRGIAPVILSHQDRVSCKQAGPWYQLDVASDSNLRQSIGVDPVQQKVIKYILADDSGKLIWEFSFAHFKRIVDCWLPMNLDLIFHESGTHIAIDYESVDLSQPLADQLFSIAPPAGVRNYTLEELSRNPAMQLQ